MDSVTGEGAIDSVIGGGASNDIDGWTGVRVDGMVVSGRDEWAGMDISGEKVATLMMQMAEIKER